MVWLGSDTLNVAQKAHGRSRISGTCCRYHGRSRDIANAVLADLAPITAKRLTAQFESAWARHCAEDVTASQPSNVVTSATVEPSQLSPAVTL